ncbi:glycerate kinase [Agrococcus sp. Ld7]|uniref:glycerate kinase n=1 Tax=Agrococcus sp. Ld7 TaxID=649148 RepID=UPI0038638DF6
MRAARVVIAPDKFKGSLEAPAVARAIADGILAVRPDAEVDLAPVADGGEGTLDAALSAGYERRSATVTGPSSTAVEADWGLRGCEAVIEMALASGLAVVRGAPDALRATSRGTGELILAALDAGATHIVLGVGGSANTDGGAGMLSALGVRMLDASGSAVADGGAALVDVVSVDASGLDPRVAGAAFLLASDVDNPLLGPQGAAAVFGPQKGARPEDVVLLELGLSRFAQAVQAAFDAAGVADAPGAGAAGGVGFAALAALDAERRNGIDVVLDFTRLHERLHGADLVVTGEGSIDEQSLGGKTPVGVARAAAAVSVPTVAVCGRTTLDQQRLQDAGFQHTYSLASREPDREISMRDAARLLHQVGEEIAARLPAAGTMAPGDSGTPRTPSTTESERA